MSAVVPIVSQATLPPAQMASFAKTAREFEATILGQLLQPMFDTVDTAHGPFGGGEGEAQWKPMLVGEMAKQISASGGLGIAQAVLTQMIHMQEQENAR